MELGGELVLDRASLSVGPGKAAVVVGPLLGEPTASLDAESSAVVWSLLERRRGGGTPMIIATHDLSWANQLQAANVLELDRR